MKQFAAILAVVFALCSVLVVPVFAAPAGDSFDSGLVDAVTQEPVYPPVDIETSPIPLSLPEETFPALPLLENEYYSYSVKYSDIGVISNSITVFGFSVFDSDGRYILGSSGKEGVFYRAALYDSYGIAYAGDFFPFQTSEWNVASQYDVIFISASSSVTIGSSTFSGSLVDNDPVNDLAESVFDIGDAFITFMISSWVVLLPLAAWLVVLCIGAIRKLIKGV